MDIVSQLMERVVKLEQRLNVLEQVIANLQYVAIMTDVELENEGGSEDGTQQEL